MSDRAKFEAMMTEFANKPESSFETPYEDVDANAYWAIWQASRRAALEEAAKVCDEYGELTSAEKDSALLVGKVDLSNAMSGEPRAATFLAGAIRALADGGKS